MKVAIAGYGLEGQSSYAYFSSQDHQVTILDQNPNIELPEGVLSVLGDEAFTSLNDFDLIVRSSGLNPNKLLEHNPDIEGKITTQLNEFLKVCTSSQIIGITGTKGKGTTCTLVSKILEASNKQVVLGGNIGVAMLSLLSKITPETYVVLELSSFQLSDLHEPSPSIAVCLMMAPEHLDWHGDEQSYYAAKANLFSHQSENDKAIYFANNDLSKQIADNSPAQKIPYFAPPGAYVKDEQIVIEDQVICSVDEIALVGEHNWQNICAAITATWLITKDVEAIRSVLTSFRGLEHRIEFVREVAGVRYYNDSYASQPKATEAAVLAIKGPKVLIVGGYDRMLNLDEFTNFISDHSAEFRSLLIIGASSGRLASSLDSVGFSNYELGDNLKTMREIVSRAQALAESNDSVVLSPGFASFDMFKNFEDRGLQFKEVVKNL